MEGRSDWLKIVNRASQLPLVPLRARLVVELLLCASLFTVPLYGHDVVRSACVFSGANAGEKIAKAIASLPSFGGTVNARCFEGTQTVTANPLPGRCRRGLYTFPSNVMIC